MSRMHAMLVVLAVSVLLTGCGKQTKLTKANFDKIYDQMPLKEVEGYLGRGVELFRESKTPPGGSFGAAAGGIALPSDEGSGPELIPPISFSSAHKVMQWEDGNRLVQMIFVNDKMKVKAKKGF